MEIAFCVGRPSASGRVGSVGSFGSGRSGRVGSSRVGSAGWVDGESVGGQWWGEENGKRESDGWERRLRNC